MAYWIDSLSAYYPGLLAIAGELEEAVTMNMLYVALWTRFSALPERWSSITGDVEGGLGWWPGRPELVESNYHLYRATKDPWYFHVGEMILKDTKRQCWAPCGWAGLQDVRTGELADRMESFFLGETTKYLFLLFDEAHPLNSLDAPFVFSTEGHPLIVRERDPSPSKDYQKREAAVNDAVCPMLASPSPFTASLTAARGDLFHAASLARLSSVPSNYSNPSDEFQDEPRTHPFYPRTLPPNLIPANGTSSKLLKPSSFEIQFPHNPNSDLANQLNVIRIEEGLVVQHLEGVKLGFIYDGLSDANPTTSKHGNTLRIETIGHLPLGRDEQVFFKKDAFKGFSDPRFAKVVDEVAANLYVEVEKDGKANNQKATSDEEPPSLEDLAQSPLSPEALGHTYQSVISIMNKLNLPRDLFNMALRGLTTTTNNAHSRTSTSSKSPKTSYHRLTAISASGIGACPLPETDDLPTTADNDQHPSSSSSSKPDSHLPWTKIYLSDETCHAPLHPSSIPSQNQVIVIRRGSCSFSEKMANIPMFRPSKPGQTPSKKNQSPSLQLVVIVSEGNNLDIRPLLDQIQRTPAGLPRVNPIPMVMVAGGKETYELLKKARGVGLKRRWSVRSQGVWVRNAIVL